MIEDCHELRLPLEPQAALAAGVEVDPHSHPPLEECVDRDEERSCGGRRHETLQPQPIPESSFHSFEQGDLVDS